MNEWVSIGTVHVSWWVTECVEKCMIKLKLNHLARLVLVSI